MESKKTASDSNSKAIKLLISIGLSLLALVVPPEVYCMDGLTVIEQRVIALFIFAALMWILEAIPIWTTSVSLIVLMLLMVSNSQFSFLNYTNELGAEQFGKLIPFKSIMATFADPIVMLFMGGFALAIGATKVGLDLNLARVMLKPFGTKSEMVLMGFMVSTALFSMFMSNTATAAMMLAIMAPVLRQLGDDHNDKTALALCIPIAANVGGIGTPIGTPPNAIALKYIEEHLGVHIDFLSWMSVMVPFVIILMAIAWFLIIHLYPFKQDRFVLQIDGSFRTDRKAIIVYITFTVTILLWAFEKLTGVNSNVVALIPLAVFATTGIIGKEELKNINWDVLWLVAGGFALGLGMQESGLIKHIVTTIPFDQWSPILVLGGSGLLCCTMSTFMSNTASANLLVPILAAVGVGMGDSLAPYGGVSAMLIGIAISASLAMALPISTPPNTLAHATGYLKQKDMVFIGILVGVIGLILGYIFTIFASTNDLL